MSHIQLINGNPLLFLAFQSHISSLPYPTKRNPYSTHEEITKQILVRHKEWRVETGQMGQAETCNGKSHAFNEWTTHAQLPGMKNDEQRSPLMTSQEQKSYENMWKWRENHVFLK
jgi:hypothetical protein